MASPPPGKKLTIQQALDLATQHLAAGRPPQAKHICTQVLRAQPEQPVALHMLGVIAKQAGQTADGIALIRRAIAAKPDFAQAHYNLGNALRDLGKTEEAIASYREAADLEPDLMQAHYNLALASRDGGDLIAAVASYRRALALKPDFAEAHYNLGNALRDLGKADEAAECYGQALALKPSFTEAHFNLGDVQRLAGKLEDAVASYRNALALKPDYADIHNNLGLAFQDLLMLDDAVVSYQRALALRPDFAQAHYNLGIALRRLGRLEQAVDSYRRAIALDPESAEANFNLGVVQLLMGDFEQGWRNYAWRWRTKDSPTRPFARGIPTWDGQDLTGKTLFVFQEQGLGDVVQFARYLPLTTAKGGRVVFEAPEPLRRLFDQSGLADQVVEAGTAPASFDYHIPLLDLPRLFKTTLDSIPSPEGYLRVSAELKEEWAARLGPPSGFRLGLVWAGNANNKNDRNRTIDAALLRPLIEIPGVTAYSLQVGRDGEASRHFGDTVTDLAPLLTDFAETAAAVSHLDLIVSVDTSPIHVAAAMGRPVWTLLTHIPDWRWLPQRPDDTPWYRSMRLFRQDKHGDWDAVIARVWQALLKELQSRPV